MTTTEESLSPELQYGLYTHIPWCRQICHYCDFAKTANHSKELRQNFMKHLYSHYQAWLKWYSQQLAVGESSVPPKLSSVFFGGGTPSIYTVEYEPLFNLLRPYLNSHSEVTLEANPDDITLQSLQVWRSLGFNRISLGVQTFDPEGLTAMHRVHSSSQAREAITIALEVFPTVNIDLIYGWNGQSAASWEHDLSTAHGLGVPHLSLYNLTYEPRTVIGRMAARGKIHPAEDERLEFYYETARRFLAAADFEHEEVSNWSRKGHSCAHNWLYWSDKPYIGIGPGAHGYIPDICTASGSPIGLRYAYPRNERLFSDCAVTNAEVPLPVAAIAIESDRTMSSWIIETIGSSFRTCRGVNLKAIETKTQLPFKPVGRISDGLAAGLLSLTPCGTYLKAAPAEWFREHYWALAVIESF